MRADFFDETLEAFTTHVPYKQFTVVLMNGNRFEVDHPSAITFREGAALYLAPGRIPVTFDCEGVSEIVGDLKGYVEE